MINVQLSATDANGDALTFSVTPNLAFVTLTDNQDGTGVLRLAPVAGQTGSYSLTVRVTDSNTASDSETIAITINAAPPSNSAPVLATIGNKTITEGNVINVQLSATDADGDPLNFSISPNLAFVTLTDFQDGTGRIQLAPVSGQAGSYSLTVSVIDASSTTDSETITITVNQAVVQNTPPVLAPIGSKAVTENEVLNIPLSSSDAQGDPMRYTVSPNLGFSSITFSQDGSGLLSLSPKPGDAGSYNLTITVLDDKDASDSETITITVNPKINGNSAPELRAVGNVKIKYGKKFQTQLSSIDADGDALTYDVSPNLRFASLTDNQDGTAILDLSPDESDIGTYSLIITVTDVNNASDSETISLIIEPDDPATIDPTAPQYVTGINSGGASYSLGGSIFAQDQFYAGGFVYDIDQDIANTEDDALYFTERFGEMQYDIPVPGYGEYMVRLHFAELYYTSGEIGTRVFNVDIENGQGSLSNYDINADVGPLTAVTKTFTGISVYDGMLTITFSKLVNNPKISAIEILTDGDLDIIAGLESDNTNKVISIFPNPTNGIFTLELPSGSNFNHDLSYVIYDLAGKIVDQSSIHSHQTNVDLSGNGKGVYIIKVGGYNLERIILY